MCISQDTRHTCKSITEGKIYTLVQHPKSWGTEHCSDEHGVETSHSSPGGKVTTTPGHIQGAAWHVPTDYLTKEIKCKGLAQGSSPGSVWSMTIASTHIQGQCAAPEQKPEHGQGSRCSGTGAFPKSRSISPQPGKVSPVLQNCWIFTLKL